MSDKFSDYLAIMAYIDSAMETGDAEVSNSEIGIACYLLDNFWRDHCERTRTLFWVLSYTIHDHAAKGLWAEADYLLRQLIKRNKSL